MTSVRQDQPFSRLGLMGGSGSSGTTLLVHLLSRDPAIGSGPEFNCFNHPEVYEAAALRRAWPELRRGRAVPAGYIDVPVFMTHREHYGITDHLIEQWLGDSESGAGFVSQLKEHLHRVLKCELVLEKSPTNIYCFRDAGESLPGVKLIHMIRDGRDVTVSLMRRGFNLFGAGSRWLYDTVRGLEAREASNYLEVRYESLVADPDPVCRSLLSHLGVDRLQPADGADHERRGLYTEQWTNRAEPRAWNQTPSDPITSRSVGQFRERLSSGDIERLKRICLHRSVAVTGGLPRKFGDLLDHLGYRDEPESGQQRNDVLSDWRLEATDYARRVQRFHNRSYWRMPRRLTQFQRSRTG